MDDGQWIQESERVIRANKTVTAAFTSISILIHDCRLLRFTWYQQMFPLIDLKWIKMLKSTNTNYNLIIMNETLTLAFILIITSDNFYFYESKTTRGTLKNAQQTILPIGEVRDKLSEIQSWNFDGKITMHRIVSVAYGFFLFGGKNSPTTLSKSLEIRRVSVK